MLCVNCRSREAIKNSHVFPEWMYENIYNSKGQFVPITVENTDNLKYMQNGFKEEMLCTGCEEILSKIERYSAVVFRELRNEQYSQLHLVEKLDTYQIVNGHRFSDLKRFLLSLLWRASVSRDEGFKSYELGPYSTKIQKIAFGINECTEFDFPIFMTRVVAGSHHLDLMMTGIYRMIGSKRCYSIYVYGFGIHYIVSEDFHWGSLDNIFLNENQLFIANQQSVELGLDPVVYNRFKSEDLRKFFNQKVK